MEPALTLTEEETILQQRSEITQLIHTVLAAVISGGLSTAVTLLITVNAISTKLEIIDKTVTKLVDTVTTVAMKQAAVVSQADEIHRNLSARLDWLEKNAK